MAEINNYDSGTLLSGTSSVDTIVNYAEAVTVKSGKGNDLVINGEYFDRGGVNFVVDAGKGNDTIVSHGAYSSLVGGAGNDAIYNGYYYYQPWSRIYSNNGEGDVTLENYNGSYSTIDAGAGNDTIKNQGSHVLIKSDAGNDSICSNGTDVTLQASGGSKLIKNDGGTLIVKGSSSDELISLSGSGASTIISGKGNDTIIGSYSAAEVFQYGGGNLRIDNYNYDDVIELKSGSIKNYTTDGGNLIFNMSDGGTITLRNMANHAITVKNSKGKTSTKIYGNGSSPVDVIKKFVQAINRSVIEEKPTLFDEAIQACSSFSSIQDVIDKMVADCRAASDAMTFLEDYCGIILNNKDTGAITGWDAGGLTAKTIDNIILETLPAATLSSLSKATFTKYGLTVNYPQKASSLSTNQKRLLQGAYSWWIEESLKLIEESYGFKFDGTSINFYATNDTGNEYWGLTSGNAASNSVSINLAYTSFEDDDDPDGNGVDRCIAHELTHVAQNVFMTYFPQFMEEGMAELTGGIDDERGTRIYNIASNADNLKTYLDIDNYKTGSANYYAAGYMFLRYMAKQISDAYDSLKSYSWTDGATIEGTSASELLTASGKGATIIAGSGDDTITAYGSNEVINGGEGDDSINAASDQKYRVYEFASDSGSDVVIGYNSSDTIRITDESRYSTVASGGDVIISIDDESMTLLDAAEETINIVGGKQIMQIYSTEDHVVGTSDDDVISLSGMRSGATINGAEGDDLIYGDSAAHVYQFGIGSGNDTIFNFNARDSIQFHNGTIYRRETLDNDVKIYVYDGSILLKNAAGKSINLMTGYNPTGIYNSVDNAKVKGTSSAEFINNTASGVKISAGKGNDTIFSGWRGANSSIDGGKGNDLIFATGGYETVDGGAGNDTVYADISNDAEGRVYKFDASGGKDVVIGYQSADTVRLTNATSCSTLKSGDDVIVSIGSARMTLKEAADETINVVNVVTNTLSGVKVSGTGVADSIVSTGKNVTIATGKGNDTITGSDNGEMMLFSYASGKDVVTNFGLNDTLKSTSGTLSYKKSGDNVIVTIKKNSTSSKVTLQGAGNYNFVKSGNVLTTDGINYINNSSDGVKVSGTSGKDWITNTAAKVTISTGKGNDTITGSDNGEMMLFSYASGKDVVTNFGVNDTIKVTSGTIKSYAASGSDYVIKIAGSSTAYVTLSGAADNLTLKKSGSTLTARAKSSIAELPSAAEDYWFTPDDSAEDELGEIIASDSAIDLRFDELSETIKTSTIELTGSARNSSLRGGNV